MLNDASEPLEPLLSAIANGDQAAFARLYALTSSHLFAVLRRMLGRRDWAEEALQDCYMRIWHKSETYNAQRGVPLAWLTTIARYRALDLLRGRRPEVNESEFDQALSSPLESEDGGQTPEAGAVEREGLNRLDQCMDGLQREQRQSVLLAYYEGYTHTELSKRMNAPIGTVKSWVRRGLMQLRDCLGNA